jgi:serine O-acetyltransferase
MANNLFLRHLQYRHRLYLKKIPVLPKILYWFDRIVFSTEIPSGVSLGDGTVFLHFGLGVVLHNRTIIGENCKIYQNVTIGSRNSVGPPVIGNNVLIGAGSIILGKITIGDGASIGAGSVVLKDVPPGCTVVGNPLKLVK